MMSKKYLLASLLIVLTLNVKCSNNVKTDDRALSGKEVEISDTNLFNILSNPLTKIFVDTKEQKSLLLSSIIQDYELILLETLENAIIGSIDKVESFDNKFYILDRKKAKGIFIFDTKGNFISKIQRIGKGPGEYSIPWDFYINSTDSSLNIWDRNLFKLSKYDKDSKYVSETYFGMSMGAINLLGDYLVFDLGYTKNSKGKSLEYNLITFSDDAKIVSRNFPFEKGKGDIIVGKSNISKYKNSLNYLPPYCDTVFNIDLNGIKPKFFIDFNGRWLPDDFFNQYKRREGMIRNLEQSDYVTTITDFLESDSFAIFAYSYNDEFRPVFYSKNTNKVLTGRSIVNDVFGGYINIPLARMNEHFVSIIEPYMLFEMKQSYEKNYSKEYLKNNLDYQKLELLIMKLEPTSNPMLLIFKLKPF